MSHSSAAASIGSPSIGSPSIGSPSIGLVTLNSKYVHLALSLRYLRNAARSAGFAVVWLREFTLKTPLPQMVDELLAQRPDVLGFSVYIWNREQSLALIEQVKRARPEVQIVIGGPEVSFEPFPPTPFVDVVIAGEGERKWVEYLRGWAGVRGAEGAGTYRPDAATLERWRTYGTDLPALEQSPYLEEDLAHLEQRLVYLETSRGCPFSCSFCLSALDKPVRFFADEQVKSDIARLIRAGARRIKFLDRTFNLRKARVMELFRFLAGFPHVQFHFEVVGDLLDDAMLDFLDGVPPGMFQFEIGVQSADPTVNARVERRQSQAKLFAAMRRLAVERRVHVHADLIWGLPGEDAAAIRRSFEHVLALRPDELQLGFLKLLPGAPIRALIPEQQYVFGSRPPYEIIRSRDLAPETLIGLKAFERVFNRYYNSGHFRFTLRRMLRDVPGWDLFQALTDHFAAQGLLHKPPGLEPPSLEPPSLEALARHLLDCNANGNAGSPRWLPPDELREWLKLDYCAQHRARRVPEFLRGPPAPAHDAVRQLKRLRPGLVLVPFWHEIHADGIPTRLVPLPAGQPAQWYAFSYPEPGSSYFFAATIERVEQGALRPLRNGSADRVTPQAPPPGAAAQAGHAGHAAL